MSGSTEQRKLAAIMFTDMVGYSALSQRDDKLALELLEEHRELLREIFPRFNGTEIKTIGDAFLVEFGSALEAAQCAIEIQRTLAKRNADASADRQIQIRIGVHIGDVVHRGGDVYGDGVNIASRIEPVAGPGGICVSMDVERQIRNALEARLEKLAPTDLKNISVSMDLYRIVLPWERPSPTAGKSESRQRQSGSDKFETGSRRMPWHEVVLAVLLILGLIAGGFFFLRHRGAQQASNPATSQPASLSGAAVPSKSIAVLPFENLSSDKENAYFADGVQDEILTNLSKIADLKVISRTSVMQYKTGTQRNLREIAQQLGVAHVLEGSVQRANNRIRVNAQLIDARSDAHLWAQTYDRDLADVFAIQSEIAKAIADQLQAKILPAEKAAIEKRPTADLNAYDFYTEAKGLLTVWIGSKDAKQSITKALGLLDEAIRRDPKFALAYCQAVWAHINFYFEGIDQTPARLALAKEAAAAALRLAPDLGETHLAQARYHYFAFRDYDTAKEELTIALRTLPNDSDAILMGAYIDRRQHRWQDSLAKMRKANELDPRNIEGIRAVASTLILMRRYAEAEEFLKRQITLVPESTSLAYMVLAHCYLDKGDLVGAKSFLAKMPLDYDPNGFGVHFRLMAAIYRRNFAEAKRQLNAAKAFSDSDLGAVLPSRSWFDAELARAEHNPEAAKAAFAIARQDTVTAWGESPNDPLRLGVIARIDAGLGRKDDAIREARRSLELRPLAQDSLDGPWRAEGLAEVYAWTGERDLALRQLEEIVRLPAGPSYGDLKFHPRWDPLRGDPHFEKIVASLAPKQ